MSGAHRTPRGLILLALVPLFVAGCCNCAAPTPGPTISAAQAAAAGASAAAVGSMNAELIDGQGGECYYRATSDGAVVVLNPWGEVEELVLLDQMPVDDTVSAGSDQALAAAKALLSRERFPDRSIPSYKSATEVHQGGVAALRVDYSWDPPPYESGRTGYIDFSVMVNAKTGAAFAWDLLNEIPNPHVPVIGKARAMEIALAKYAPSGGQVPSARMTIDFQGGDPHSAWLVELGASGAAPSGMLPPATVGVDAVTGEATIERPGTSPASAQCVPASAEQAVAAAKRVSGRSDLTASRHGSFYRADDSNTETLVDSLTGAVDEVVFVSDLPETGAVLVTADAAQAAAETFMQKAGYSVTGLTVSVTQVRPAGVSSYQVSWKDPSASDDDFDVFVNAGSGAVFAFLDRRQGVGLVAPLMGQTTATNLATAAIRAPATLWSLATLTLGFDSDSTWSLTYGVPDSSPGAADPTAWHNIWAGVDAVSGQVSGIDSNEPGAS
jgi:hypothetical protein